MKTIAFLTIFLAAHVLAADYYIKTESYSRAFTSSYNAVKLEGDNIITLFHQSKTITCILDDTPLSCKFINQRTGATNQIIVNPISSTQIDVQVLNPSGAYGGPNTTNRGGLYTLFK